MQAQNFQRHAHAGLLHHISTNVYAFEHGQSPSSVGQTVNYLLFIPGLYNTLLTPHYPTAIAERLPETWRLCRVMLSSTGGAWGTKSLMQDAQELAQVVDHFRTLQKQQQRASGSVSNVFTGKIALMGHSTGCQDIIEYLCGGAHVDIQGLNGAPRVARNPVEAAILQAPVSDREALELSVPAASLADAVTVAENLVAEKRSHEIMPSALTMQALGPAPVSAARFLALASPGPKHAGADDYFSSDLDEARLGTTFGRIPRGVQLQVLMSEADEHVPERVDKEALVERWKEMVVAVWDEDGGVIDGARHGLDGEESEHAVRNVIGRVLRLLERVRSS